MIRLSTVIQCALCCTAASLALLTFTTRPVAAQEVIAGLLGSAAQGPAPSWVKPGLRLTYYMAVASVRGQGKDWKPDKDGGLVDAQGNHWSGTDKLAVGGRGYIQHDVVGIDSSHVALQQSDYMLNLQEPLTLLGSAGVLAPAGTGGELWVNPSVLKQLPHGMRAGFQIYRAPYHLGNAARDAEWIHQESSSGTTLFIYDRSTGVLLHYASAGKPTPGPIRAPDEFENTSNVMMYQSTLADQRMLKLPWAGDDVSGWIAHAGTLHYQGVAMTSSPGFPNSAVRQNITDTITMQSHSGQWAVFAANLSAGRAGSSQTQLVEGNAQIGALWIAPQSLSHLQAGQEIDRDPVTSVVTRVGRPGRSEETVISTVGPTFQMDFHYDTAHGDLIGMEHAEHHPYAVKQFALSLQR